MHSIEKKIRVLLADDHAMLRTGLRMLINNQPDMEIIDEAKDGFEAMEKVKQLLPDVAIIDIRMPGINGIKTIERLSQLSPATRTIALSMYDDASYLRSVIEAGGLGFVIKRSADVALISAIRTVHQGSLFIDPAAGFNLVQELIDPKPVLKPVKDLLSVREREVLLLLARGYTNQQVADRISISIKTAETYRSRVARKLGLRKRVDFVNYALSNGLLSNDPACEDETALKKQKR